MTDAHEHQAREEQLELLLRELLDEDAGTPSSALKADVALPEVAELADMARRLRAASQEVPLPEGWTASLQTLLTAAAARLNGNARAARGAVRRGPRRWSVIAAVAAAAALVLGLFDIGTSLAWNAGSPSSPWYGARVALVELQVALAPSPLGKAEKLVKAVQTRIVEIEAISASADIETLRRAADVLDGEAGWLHAVMTTLSAADQERVVSQLIAVTGTFSEATLRMLSRGFTTPLSEPPGNASADRKTRVSTVARAAAQLKAEGKLPQGLTVGDLVSQAANEHAVAPVAPVAPGGMTHGDTGAAGGPPGKYNRKGRSEPTQIIPGQYPNVTNLTPYSAETNYMSLAGYLRYLTHQRTNKWLTFQDAARIIRQERGATAHREGR